MGRVEHENVLLPRKPHDHRPEGHHCRPHQDAESMEKAWKGVEVVCGLKKPPALLPRMKIELRANQNFLPDYCSTGRAKAQDMEDK